jgi:hypothetical protein
LWIEPFFVAGSASRAQSLLELLWPRRVAFLKAGGKHMKITHLAIIAGLFAVLSIMATDVWAAKDRFYRTKPHVNPAASKQQGLAHGQQSVGLPRRRACVMSAVRVSCGRLQLVGSAVEENRHERARP